MSESSRESSTEPIFQTGTLWHRICDRTRSALSSGDLQPIATASEVIEDQGIRFLVRILTKLDRKIKAGEQQQKKGAEFNPFSPYEEALFVANLTQTHLCLLNKFNVVDHHVLIIPRAFEEQENLLTIADFEALWTCLNEWDGLAFYNGGPIAGASQRHKHLQVVPFPLSSESDVLPDVLPDAVPLPIAPLIAEAQGATVPGLPFVHSFARFQAPVTAAATVQVYREALQAIGAIKDASAWQQAAPYNLLMTREWLLVVPRSQESVDSIFVNSLGYAGALLVRDREHLEQLQKIRPMNLLTQAAIALD